MKKLFYPIALILSIGIGLFLMYSIWGAVSPRTAQQYLQSGKQYFDKKEYPEAIVEFRNALQKDPRQREAHLLLAKGYLAQNDLNSAAKQLRTLLEYFPDDPEGSVQLGNIYLTGGRQNAELFRQSKEIAEKILAKEPNNIEATVLLGNALAGLEDYTSSIAQFDRALRLDPQNSSTLVSLGATEAVRKNYAEAEKAFLKAREVDPKNKGALVSLASFYTAIGRREDAEAMHKEALSLYPADREVYLAAVALYYRSGRFEEAEQILKNAQAKSPEDPTPSLVLVGYYRARKRGTDATALLRDLREKFPQDRTVALELAAALLQSDPEAARKEIDAILQSDPQSIPAQILLAELQFRARQYDQTVATLSGQSILSSRYPQVHLYLGLIAASKGQTDKALDHYKSSLDRDANYTPSRLALAGLLLRLGRVADTKVELKKVLDVQPGSVEGLLLQASVDTLEKKFAEAEKTFTTLQKELPDNANVHLRTGMYYQLRGMASQAEKSLLRALELEPDSDDILTNVAQFHAFRRETDKAIKVIHDTVPDAKKRAFHHELIGKVYSSAGRSAEAETAFKKALSMEPDRVEAMANLATEYINMKRFDEALKEIDVLLKQTPTNASAYMMKAMIYQVKSDLNQAKENYNRSLQLDANLFVSANNLAYLLAEEGRDLELALTHAQTARRLSPDSDVSADTLGWVHHKMGRNTLAREQLQFAVSKQPDNPTYQYHLALIYKETKQIPLAQAALKKALSSKADFKEKSLAEAALKELGQGK